MIEYHEYRTGERDYGDDHKLTNNWNPEQDYGKEYAKVYFNMESEGYSYPSFSFTEEQREKFTDDINKIFSSIGWTCEEPERVVIGKMPVDTQNIIVVLDTMHGYLHMMNWTN